MKRLILTLSILAIAAPAFAQARAPRAETIIVRDGKVIKDGEVFHFDGELFGGKRAYLGVSLIDISGELRQHYGAPKDAGLLVGSVEENGPAAKAGVKVGDLILAIDGHDVASASELRRELRDKKDGDSVRVDLLRNKSRQTVVASVVEKEPLLRRTTVEGIPMPLREALNAPEWRARLERSQHDCDELQTKLREIETRMKELEKKLQK